MAEPRRSVRGFTLIEMMVAIAILAFGITALIGVLTVGVSTRRSAEQKSRAVLLSGQILHQLQEQVFATPGKANDPAAKPGSDPDLIQVDRVDGFPGMSYQVRFTHDPDHPDLVLALVSVRWREQGETVAEEFSRILRREEPFSRRVSRIRSTR
jgi:prepilin-type N-terminal cleavage/methylation domain-containing protein